ncbi:His Kinase A (phospho-acceptor) domain-containing protein [Natronincola peptidivorans]|uniref:histidine kinase n=1 Tax=Natronincola peptidivorans TaxID=426128 RepID=A0A1I0E5B9_9FIRM|nr:HAMP domain-containing sensor histidine kinase [Natronincola peptidivorans]SET40343.1 His Kinase A (phospho-acceptor) domain-containing protein [Natronincola peptidivorans]
MKKVISLFILIVFVMTTFVGCFANTTEEEGREDLPDEVETEFKKERQREEGRGEIKTQLILEMGIEQPLKSDRTSEAKEGVHDLDKVYDFIFSKYPEYMKNDFDMWRPNFFDLDSDGREEVVFTTSNGKGRLQEVIVIKATDHHFIEIPSYIPFARYENSFTFQDGFLVHIGKRGLPGSFEYNMNLYIYDGFRMVDVLDGVILIKKEVSLAGENYTVTSEINGNLRDFTITHIKTDYLTGLEEIIAINHYRYHEGMYFWRTPLSLSNRAKSFNEVYKGSNLLETIEYFHQNLYHFDEDRRRDFSINLINVIEKDKQRIFEDHGSLLDYISGEPYDVKTNILDTSDISRYVIEGLNSITNNKAYKIAKYFYTTEGYIEDMGFTVTIDPRVFEMIKPALDYAYPERFTPYDYRSLEPILAPNVDFYSAKQVELLPMVYPNVYVNSYEDVKKLEGSEAWKTNIILPLIIPPPDNQKKLKIMVVILSFVIMIIGYGLIRSLRKLIDTKKLLENSIKQKEKFMADISHDLRTPIMSIMGYMDTILDEEMRNKIPIDNYLKRTQSNILYISRLVEDLFTISKLENNQIKLNKKKTNINKLIEEVVFNLQNTAEKKDINIITELEATKDRQLEIDYTRIRQVLVNTIYNAVKHSPQGGKIMITTKHKEDKKIQIAIEDSGMGIALEEIHRVFDRYYRSKNNMDSQSTGLGLCIAKELVVKHGGKIWAESQVNKGTTFFVEI